MQDRPSDEKIKDVNKYHVFINHIPCILLDLPLNEVAVNSKTFAKINLHYSLIHNGVFIFSSIKNSKKKHDQYDCPYHCLTTVLSLIRIVLRDSIAVVGDD